jgi:glycosyltransferase involved in cell wall biosynthesis
VNDHGSIDTLRDGWLMIQNPPRMRLLIVVSELPWPPRRNGISLRFAPVIEYLSSRHEVDLVMLGHDAPTEPTPPAFLRCSAVSYLSPDKKAISVGMRKLRTILTGLHPHGEPFGAIRHEDWSGAIRSLIEHIDRVDPAVILWAADYQVALAIHKSTPRPRFVFDLVDSRTLYSKRLQRRFGFLKLVNAYTTWKWSRIERHIIESVDATIYISHADSSTVMSAKHENVFVVPNGVYIEDALHEPHDYGRDTAVIGFLGNMSYPPNVDAVQRLVKRVLPLVLLRNPDVRVLIIGRDPAPSIESLRSERVTLTGSVPEIWSSLSRVDAFVFPMTSGAGLQNKILDAMHAGIPVVTSSLAWESIRATPDTEILVADTDEELALRTTRLLEDESLRRAIGSAGMEFVNRTFGWPVAFAKYEAALLGKPP